MATSNSEKQQVTSDRIQGAYERHGEGLFALTSAGVDSALMVHNIHESGVKVPVLHINTGFLFPETIRFRDQLRDTYDLDIRVIGPDQDLVEDISRERLWETDLRQYRELTKISPLRDAIEDLGVTALLAGVRADQTVNRASLAFETNGATGETRIHPLLDWTSEEVDTYMTENGLPRHPLYYQGYESVDDWTVTTTGFGRNGRPDECGLH